MIRAVAMFVDEKVFPVESRYRIVHAQVCVAHTEDMNWEPIDFDEIDQEHVRAVKDAVYELVSDTAWRSTPGWDLTGVGGVSCAEICVRLIDGIEAMREAVGNELPVRAL